MGRLATSRGFTTPRPPHGNGNAARASTPFRAAATSPSTSSQRLHGVSVAVLHDARLGRFFGPPVGSWCGAPEVQSPRRRQRARRSARRARTLDPLLRSSSPRAQAAFSARRWQDLLPYQKHRAGATHDADAVHGTPCCFGTPTAPSISALLRGVGATQPVAQQRCASDSEDEGIHLLPPERPARSAGGSGRRHHRRGRDGATAATERRPVHV
jgi:hypothetical protein